MNRMPNVAIATTQGRRDADDTTSHDGAAVPDGGQLSPWHALRFLRRIGRSRAAANDAAPGRRDLAR